MDGAGLNQVGLNEAGLAKAELRRQLRAARRQRSEPDRGEADRGEAGQRLAEFAPRILELGDGPIAGFIPSRWEPPIEGLLSALVDAGRSVLLPIPLPDGALAWAAKGGDSGTGLDAEASLHPTLRVPMPTGEPIGFGAEPVASCCALLIPALAASGDGSRLGQGGGFYDRLLAGLKEHGLNEHGLNEHGQYPRRLPMLIAVVWDDEVLATGIPREPHDESVDAILTPTSLRQVRR